MGKYVVYIITYSGKLMPPYYIGSTSKEKIKNGYLGSIRSKKWKNVYNEEILNNMNLFSISIISEHKSREKALVEENNIQKENSVVKSPLFFNESYANINGYFGRDVSNESNPMFGKTNEVVAINIITNEKIRVSKEEFDNNPNLFGHTIGMISVTNKKTGVVEKLKKEEYQKNKEKYKHSNDGMKHTKQTKDKLSKMRKNMITAKDWNGDFFRVYKDDIRFKNGEFGNTTSKRWLIEDLEGDVFKTFNFKKFFQDRNLQYPRKEHINEKGVISFKRRSNKLHSVDGWVIKCLD